VETGDEYDGRLHRDVDRERDEGEADQSQRLALAIVTGARQFPEHDRARTNLNEAVETESRKCDRTRPDGGEREHDDADNVPAERDAFEHNAAAEQSCSIGRYAEGHRAGA